MLHNRSLIYFAKGQWDDIWRNRQQLMSLFARHNRVLYVENRTHLPHVLRDLRRGDLRWRDFFAPAVRRAQNVDGELYVLRFPLWMPISGRAPLRQITEGLRRWLLRRVLRRRGFAQPIVWYSHPSMVDAVDEVPQQAMKIYHAVDEYQAYAGNRTQAQREVVRRQEEALIQQVDAVIVVSENLYRSQTAAASQHAHRAQRRQFRRLCGGAGKRCIARRARLDCAAAPGLHRPHRRQTRPAHAADHDAAA